MISALISIVVFLLGIIGYGIQTYLNFQKTENETIRDLVKGFSSRIDRELGDISDMIEKNRLETKDDIRSLSTKLDLFIIKRRSAR